MKVLVRPFARFGVVPIGGRSTAVKLNNGDVWVLASTPFGSRTKATLDGMGKVRCVISLSCFSIIV